MSTSRSNPPSSSIAGIVAGYAPLDSGLLIPRAYLPGRSAKLDNMTATAAPAVGNDNTQGYGVGSMWFDTTNKNAYVCVDASTGAAVWRIIPNKPNMLTQTVNAAATWTIPTGSVPLEGAAIIGTDGTDGVGICSWYRQGTFNMIDAIFSANSNWNSRHSTFSAGGQFSLWLASNNPGATINITNSNGYGRTVYFWPFVNIGLPLVGSLT